jgi:acyl carrier protein
MTQTTDTPADAAGARRAERRAQLGRLIVESGDGNLGPEDLRRTGGSLRNLGYSSLSYMRLIDAIENEIGVFIDPEADLERFGSVESILEMVVEGLEGTGA